MERVHAVVLSGGSAFGLAAADGTVRFLEEAGIGYPVGPFRVPIVPAAILFDLGVQGPGAVRPGADCGYRAAAAAGFGPGAARQRGRRRRGHRGQEPRRGPSDEGRDRLGLAEFCGTAWWWRRSSAVNAVGDVVDPADGRVVAGVRDDGGNLADARRLLLESLSRPSRRPRRGQRGPPLWSQHDHRRGGGERSA